MFEALNCLNCCIGDFKRDLCDCNGDFCRKYKGVGKTEDFIKKIMSAQSERKKGKKIVKSSGMMGYYACDQCDKPVNPGDNYCPNCGTDIRGDEE